MVGAKDMEIKWRIDKFVDRKNLICKKISIQFCTYVTMCINLIRLRSITSMDKHNLNWHDTIYNTLLIHFFTFFIYQNNLFIYLIIS